jgi:hypothetical protein
MEHERTARNRWTGLVSAGLALLGVATIGVSSFAVSAAGASPTPPYIPPDAPWLTTVNYYRAMAGLSPVSENVSHSAGAQLHSCWMLLNGMSHDEAPGTPGYTTEGDAAGNNGNVAVSSAVGASPRNMIELWMTGPFHAIGLLRPNLQTAGFGRCDNPNTSPWRSGATLDVLRGLGPSQPRTQPILWPGNGTTTNLDRFIAETPDPRTFCGWPTNSAVGLPVIALMPESTPTVTSASVIGPNGPMQSCVLTTGNTNGVANAILGGDNAVVVIPRTPLTPGSYTVSVQTPARSVTWTFTQDPAAATGVMPPPAEADPEGPSVGFEPLTPVRLIDTRIGLGATRLAGSTVRRIVVAGANGIPSGARAIAANVTVTDSVNGGYVTAWNCSTDRPEVATVNFEARDVVPNGATIPLDAGGGLCLFASVDTDVVVDVSGFYSEVGVARFEPVTPARLVDTRIGIGHGASLVKDGIVAVQIAGHHGVPTGSRAVALNVAAVDAVAPGFLTAWPCDQPRSGTANIILAPGDVRSNLAVVPLAADGTVCFYASNPVDLVVDLTGYLGVQSDTTFTATVPFRFTDTRDRSRPELHAGTGGNGLGGGQTIEIQMAGRRGIPSDATAVSINLAVTGSPASGYLTAFPCGERPPTATVNHRPWAASSNGAQVPLSPTGSLCVFTYVSAHVIVDVNGWWS